ncbi:hypothetical protein V6U89_00085 [Micromonospora sp. CPCC 206171]|uniref:hypothetical protein n=1 Tax=Micromonospora sp. CPCC 206171 TaxID=3122405 RepID=UPI002FF1D550
MPMDDGDITSADELFAMMRIIDAHWIRALDVPWRAGGCLECRDRNNCPQLDWALGMMADIASVMFQKR